MYRWLVYNIFRFESFIRVLCHYTEYVLFESLSDNDRDLVSLCSMLVLLDRKSFTNNLTYT